MTISLIHIDVFQPGEYIRINIDGDYVENDDDAFRIIARHLTSPSMRSLSTSSISS